MDSGDAGCRFIICQVKKLVIKNNKSGYSSEAEGGGYSQVHVAYGEYTSKQIGTGVGMKHPGGYQGDGNAYGNRQYNSQNQIRIFSEILTEKFNRDTGNRGKNKSRNNWTCPENRPRVTPASEA